tara:strand:- start:116 stop:313 length:198 start_codon:yes stop_codon:yes gene_type:complete
MNEAEIVAIVHREIDTKLNSFLKREEKELEDLFAKVKSEDAERINIILEGVRSHTARLKALEEAI